MRNNNSDITFYNNKQLQHGELSAIPTLKSFSNNRATTDPLSVLNIIDEAQKTTFSQEKHNHLVKNNL